MENTLHPGAFVRHSWLPHNVNRIPTLASATSQDSIISQIPLPFHLPADSQGYESGSEHSPSVTQQAWAQSPQFLSQPHMLAQPIPLHPSPIYPMQQQMGQDYPAIMAGQEYNGYAQQPQMSQVYYPQQSQPYYQGDQFAPVPMNYPQENFQYHQQLHYGVSNGYNVMHDSTMAYQEPVVKGNPGVGGFERHRGYAPPYDSRNFSSQNQHSFGPTDRRGSQNQVNYNWNSNDHAFMHNDPLGRPGFGTRSQMQNRPTVSRGLGARVPSNNLPPGPVLGRSTSLNGPKPSFRGRGKPNNPRYVSAGYGNSLHCQSSSRPSSRQGSEPPKGVPKSRPDPVGQLKDNIVLTPSKVASSSPKNSTPVTARQLGEITPNVSPVLRSRRHQSVARASVTFKIDPLKGPPPAFWPGGIPPADTSEELSPKSKVGRTRSSTATVTVINPDPFTNASPGALLTTPAKGQSASSTLTFNNPFEQIISPAGPIGPLLLNPRQAYSGPSRHMRILSPNGIKPVIDVAFDPQNMPFVEPARLHSGLCLTGVVRISNVSTNLVFVKSLVFGVYQFHQDINKKCLTTITDSIFCYSSGDHGLFGPQRPHDQRS